MTGKRTALTCLLLVVLVAPAPLVFAAAEEQPEAVQPSQQETQPQPATAEKPQEKDSQGTTGEFPEMDMPIDGSASFIQSVMALTFVLGMIFLTAYLYKRFTGVRTGGFGGNRIPIQMVGTMSLGEKRFLSIVEIQGRHYFLGITPNSVNMLSELDLEIPEQPPADSRGDFESIFKKARLLLQKGPRKDN